MNREKKSGIVDKKRHLKKGVPESWEQKRKKDNKYPQKLILDEESESERESGSEEKIKPKKRKKEE